MDAYARALKATEVFLKLNTEYERLRLLYPFLTARFGFELRSGDTGFKNDESWKTRNSTATFVYFPMQDQTDNMFAYGMVASTWLIKQMFYWNNNEAFNRSLYSNKERELIETFIREDFTRPYKATMLSYCEMMEDLIVAKVS